MNVFSSRDAFIGQGETAVFCVAWEEFLNLAGRLRRELGARKYHLDRYLLLLFRMRNAYNAGDALDEGSALFSTNYREAKTEKETGIALNEKYTKTSLIAAMMAGFTLKENIGSYHRQQHIQMAARCDIIALNQYYNQLCAFLGREEDMAQLNDFFASCFLKVTASTVFLEGYVTELVGTLLTRDAETDHTVLQLLLDYKREGTDV